MMCPRAPQARSQVWPETDRGEGKELERLIILNRVHMAGMRGTTRTPLGLIQLGDIIVQIDGAGEWVWGCPVLCGVHKGAHRGECAGPAEINNEADLFKTLEKYRPGDKIKIVVTRITSETGVSENVVLQIKLKGSDEMRK